MKVGVLFSGGKDSTYAAYLAQKKGHELACLISVISANEDSYMFHTPAVSLIPKQAEAMGLPLLQVETKGEKEKELKDLAEAISRAKEAYGIEGVVTGAVASVYQASRIEKICDTLSLKCVNPLWQMDQIGLLKDLVKNRFKVIVTAVAAYPLDGSFVGRIIDDDYIKEVGELQKKFKINPAGEGGEFETAVLECPLFAGPVAAGNYKVTGKDNSFRMVLNP
ncbi:MAG: diphthine--ammonia ligase [archaeon]